MLNHKISLKIFGKNTIFYVNKDDSFIYLCENLLLSFTLISIKMKTENGRM